MLNKCWITRLI